MGNCYPNVSTRIPRLEISTDGKIDKLHTLKNTLSVELLSPTTTIQDGRTVVGETTTGWSGAAPGTTTESATHEFAPMAPVAKLKDALASPPARSK